MHHLYHYLAKQVLPLLSNQHTYWANALGYLCTIFVLSILAIIIGYTIKLILLPIIRHAFEKSGLLFLHIIAENKAIHLIPALVSLIIFYLGSNFVDVHDSMQPLLHTIVHDSAILVIFLLIILSINRLIWSINAYYEQKFTVAIQYPIYSYLRVIMLVVWVVGTVLLIAIFANTSPVALITGISAVSAVFLLVFKDTLLGIASSIQVAASNMVRIGDEICINKYNIDGVVTDIRINNVKIRNEDNTMVSIPTYYLTTEIVKNWRGVKEAGAWLMHRAINLDMTSIKFVDDQLVNKLTSKFPEISSYLPLNASVPVTNLALYRQFITNYLMHHPHIAKRSTILVHHLAPTNNNALPLELYAYINYTNYVDYQNIQAEILEYSIAHLTDFNLSIWRTITCVD